MKKTEINATVKDAFTKFELEVPGVKDVMLDRRHNTVRVVTPSAVPAKLVNSLARTWGVKPENVTIGSTGIDRLELQFPLAA